jgi:stage II sporulation protein GA (sporulation sigma-E factor processing peptidase)
MFSFAFLLPVKIIVSMLMIWIAFGASHPLSYVRNLFVFYFICFLTGGAMIALHYLLLGENRFHSGMLFTMDGWGSPVSWIFIVAGFPLVWIYTKLSFQSIKERQETHQYLTRLKVKIGQETFECTGLVDTGNLLRDPIFRTPVMMVELTKLEAFLPAPLKESILEQELDNIWNQLPQDWIKRIRVIPYRVAGNKGDLMLALKPDWVKVLQKKEWHTINHILIGIDSGHLSSDGTFQAIIHPSCFQNVS